MLTTTRVAIAGVISNGPRRPGAISQPRNPRVLRSAGMAAMVACGVWAGVEDVIQQDRYGG